MNSIGDVILNARKSRQLTQEELADLSKVNLRTIQRIENKENIPRGNTLKLICDALDLRVSNFKTEKVETKSSKYVELVFNYFFLIIINLTLTGIIGFMTLDSEANLNSRFGGLLLSFFIPVFIVFKTEKMSRTERLLKFGVGFLIYIILATVIVGFPKGFITGLLVCLPISLLTLYYGDLLRKND